MSQSNVFDILHELYTKGCSMYISDQAEVPSLLGQAVEVASTLKDFVSIFQACKRHHLDRTAVDAKFSDFFKREFRKAKSFGEIMIFLVSVPRDLPEYGIILRRVIPMSDSRQGALQVLDYTNDGTREEKKAIERFFLFLDREMYGLEELRKVFTKHTNIGSTRERLVLKKYEKLLKNK